MNFASAVCSAFDKLTVTDGRASRSEFWWFMLFVVLVAIYPSNCLYYSDFFEKNLVVYSLLQIPLILFIAFMARKGFKCFFTKDKYHLLWIGYFLISFFLEYHFLYDKKNSLPELLNIFISSILAVPTLSVAIRRLHDVDKSAWFLFWWCFPSNVIIVIEIFNLFVWEDILSKFYFIGPYVILYWIVLVIIFLFYFCKKSDPAVNNFG